MTIPNKDIYIYGQNNQIMEKLHGLKQLKKIIKQQDGIQILMVFKANI